MLLGSYQVADVLMLVGNVAPIALYFLVLGLVNSHARPFLISSRCDFVLLTSVLVPILLWPVPILAHGKAWLLLAAGLVAAACAFRRLLPGRDDGFVIYNIAESRGRKVVEDALRAVGMTGRWDGASWVLDQGGVVSLRKIAVLRNISLTIEPADLSLFDRRLLMTRLEAELAERLKGISQLPSTMGACLVMLGVGLMLLPMWMVSRHIDDVVDAMSHLFG